MRSPFLIFKDKSPRAASAYLPAHTGNRERAARTFFRTVAVYALTAGIQRLCSSVPPPHCELRYGNRSLAELACSPASAGGRGGSRRGNGLFLSAFVGSGVRGLFVPLCRAAGSELRSERDSVPHPAGALPPSPLGLCPRPRQGLTPPLEPASIAHLCAFMPTFVRLCPPLCVYAHLCSLMSAFVLSF